MIKSIKAWLWRHNPARIDAAIDQWRRLIVTTSSKVIADEVAKQRGQMQRERADHLMNIMKEQRDHQTRMQREYEDHKMNMAKEVSND